MGLNSSKGTNGSKHKGDRRNEKEPIFAISNAASDAPWNSLLFFCSEQGEKQSISRLKDQLVGDFNPSEKYACQIGWFPQVGGEHIKCLKPAPSKRPGGHIVKTLRSLSGKKLVDRSKIYPTQQQLQIEVDFRIPTENGCLFIRKNIGFQAPNRGSLWFF